MSKLTTLVRRLVATVFTAPRAASDLDAMPLRDWADLPAHHPLS